MKREEIVELIHLLLQFIPIYFPIQNLVLLYFQLRKKHLSATRKTQNKIAVLL